jgi:hypothetical protein
MKYLIIILIFFAFSCKVQEKTTCYNELSFNSKNIVNTNEFRDELNKSIIDGFYDNDTSGISHKIYLIK